MMQEKRHIRLTGVRREIKYLLDPDAGKIARSLLANKLPEKKIRGNAVSFRVSMYLDDETRQFSQAVLDRREVLTKLRVREYYVLNGNTPETGNECFIEMKSRSGQIVEKSRFRIDRRSVKGLLARKSSIFAEPQQQLALNTFEEFRNGHSLDVLFVVHYRRYTLQDPDDRIRITIDDVVSYHMPPENILSNAKPAFFRRDLPPPFIVEPNWIIEVKTLGTAPEWVDKILDPHNKISYSKFSVGVLELERNNRLYKIFAQ